MDVLECPPLVSFLRGLPSHERIKGLRATNKKPVILAFDKPVRIFFHETFDIVDGKLETSGVKVSILDARKYRLLTVSEVDN